MRYDEVVMPGAKACYVLCTLALVNEGDEVIYPNPGFPIYESMINFVGGKAVPLKLEESKRIFHSIFEDLKKLITLKTKLIIINTPQNPTGGILTEDTIRKIADVVKDTDMVLSDRNLFAVDFHGRTFQHYTNSGMLERTIILLKDFQNICNDRMARRLRSYAKDLADLFQS